MTNKEMGEQFMLYLWLALTVVFAIAEAVSAQLATVWFALGAFVSFLLALFGVKNITLQVIVFFVVSVLLLILTRPLVKRILNRKNIQPTNADRNVGQTGIVTEDVNNIEGRGAVNVKGTIWAARSADNGAIAAGELVKVLRIEGVKLIVEKTTQEE